MLILDTSTERGVVAILKERKVLFEVEFPFGLQNSKHLLPELHHGFELTKKDVSQFDFIAVGIGPGSYTGIRVGVTVAKTLAFAIGIPLVGVCALEGFIPSIDTTFAAVIDAKIGGVYLQKGVRQNGVISITSLPMVCELAEGAELLKDVELLITPNAGQLQNKLESISTCKWQWQECYPSPTRMAELAIEKFQKGNYSTDGHLELLYMRKTQAEIEREQKQKNKFPLDL